MITIEKNIPIPELKAGRKSNEIYPLSKMEIMDSFFIETNSKEDIQSIRSHIHNPKNRKNKKFATRTVNGGIRVWRIK